MLWGLFWERLSGSLGSSWGRSPSPPPPLHDARCIVHREPCVKCGACRGALGSYAGSFSELRGSSAECHGKLWEPLGMLVPPTLGSVLGKSDKASGMLSVECSRALLEDLGNAGPAHSGELWGMLWEVLREALGHCPEHFPFVVRRTVHRELCIEFGSPW